MSTAVVILNWNGASLLRTFLPTVITHTTAVDTSIYVADNGSTDDSLTVLRDEFPTVNTIVLDQNYGFAEGYNRALAQIEADYYVLLNSDVAVTAGWLTPLIAYLDAHPDVAIVQPKIRKYGTTAFEYAGAAGGFLDKYGYPYCRGRLLTTVEEDTGQYDTPLTIHWASGACCVIRAADYWQAGGLDATFFAHQEEIDLCWRVRQRGRAIVCLPQSTVYHVGGASLQQGNPRKTYLNYRNNAIMIYKNMPTKKLHSVLIIRALLDLLAAMKELVTGHPRHCTAIIRAKRDAYKMMKQCDRDAIQRSRVLPDDADTTPVALLWQYYLLRRRTWQRLRTIVIIVALLTATLSVSADDDTTRGIGIYPGRLSEAVAPVIHYGDSTYRNLALNHTAYHSSAYDYCLTSQLITDGIIATAEPAYTEVLVNGVALPKHEREYAFDGNEYNTTTLIGDTVSLQIIWHNRTVVADSIAINGFVTYHRERATQGYQLTFTDHAALLAIARDTTLIGTDMGYELHSDPNKQTAQSTLPARVISQGFSLSRDTLSSFCAHLSMPGAEYWTIKDISFFYQGHPVDTDLLAISSFSSVWRSETGGDQWVTVDLGDTADISCIAYYWLVMPPTGHIDISDDLCHWTTIAALPTDSLTYTVPVSTTGRYLRTMVSGSNDPYELSEIAVYGTGGTTYTPYPAAIDTGNRLSLNGGPWTIARVDPTGSTSTPVIATVPATALTSYVNLGAIPLQTYDNNTQYASEAFFYADFIYQRQFTIPDTFKKQRVFLNCEGINHKARLLVNGTDIGRIEGAFMRGKFDITSLLQDDNTLTIIVERPPHPGATKEKNYLYPTANGGLLGADNPTFHASVGWDWIPTVRGREVGIWNDVFLTSESRLLLADPLVTTTLNLPDTLCTITPSIDYNNLSATPITATIQGFIGSITFERDLTISPGVGTITFSPDEFAVLHNTPLNLWWPNGYGTPYLYDAGFTCIDKATGDTLATTTFRYGARQVTCEDVDTELKIYVNGQRIVPLGGNWGFPEMNLNYRQREYDYAVKAHRDMNFNIIRNWVGQTADKAFFDACDKYGILVWQDFCLANPADGPDPIDEHLFECNALDCIAKLRQHPCVVLYCGRNEGYPSATLDTSLRNIIATYHPGITYISSSADEGVSGHGPYNALPEEEYFSLQTHKFHSERGMPNVPNYESLQRMMTDEHLWPQSDTWGIHDFTINGAIKGNTFNTLVTQRFGTPASAQQFAQQAQLVNYNGYRAMYEASYTDRLGLLIWMSHPAWPSLAWQCYDYFLEPTAAYFACKKACEPLHIQYNALTHYVEVVNITQYDHRQLHATVERYNLDGKRLKHSEIKVRAPHDTTTPLINISNTDFLRLTLYDGNTLVSTNDYLLANDLTQLNTTTIDVVQGDITTCDSTISTTVTITNTGDSTAYLVRLNLLGDDGQQILPVFYSDNYFHLLPKESRTVTITWQQEDSPSTHPTVTTTALNITNVTDQPR